MALSTAATAGGGGAGGGGGGGRSHQSLNSAVGASDLSITVNGGAAGSQSALRRASRSYASSVGNMSHHGPGRRTSAVGSVGSRAFAGGAPLPPLAPHRAAAPGLSDGNHRAGAGAGAGAGADDGGSIASAGVRANGGGGPPTIGEVAAAKMLAARQPKKYYEVRRLAPRAFSFDEDKPECLEIDYTPITTGAVRHTHTLSFPSLCLHCYLLLLLLLLKAKGLHTPLHLPPLHSDTHAARPKDCEVPLRIRRLNRKISVFICVTAYTEGANQLRRTLEAVAESLYERASRRHTVMCEWH